jgi:DNA-binding transcriptional LysR family regulator
MTNAMKKLERELGEPLLERGRTVRLTPFGCQMMAQFYRMNDICESIDALLASRAAEITKNKSAA